ncbi:hypothetical protein [Burkholderia anthina]|uniref:hypothetical protein n=1 Tax=Burkholderia anthina TaxID=179879 RepID=UPI00158E1CAB|nr:hypothetical protein [Burkholderia anthina]
MRDVIHVQFDIAPEDPDVTPRMPVTLQADAVIGPVARRLHIGSSQGRQPRERRLLVR